MDQLNLFNQENESSTPDLTGLTKLYYTISEVATLFQINASTLRFWEKEFPTQLGKLRKNKKGDRYYSKEDMEKVKLIYHLVKEKKMTLEGAREYLKDTRKSIKDSINMVETLEEVKQFLISLKKSINE